MTERISEVVRNTNETKIRVRVNLDGTGQRHAQHRYSLFRSYD